MLSDLCTWRRAYRLVYFLHQDPVVVEDIIREALDGISQIRARQRKRPELRVRDIPVRTRFDETSEVFFQLSLFETSERWEKAQELRAAPEPPILLGRYIKHCVWQGLGFANSRYTALGLGCLLYQYTPPQMCKVFGFDESHYDRIIDHMHAQLAVRFQHIASQGNQALTRRVPTDGERQLVRHALTLFTPWGAACPRDVVLPPEVDALPEALHHHVIIHPVCAGIAQSVRAWNRQQSALPRNRQEPQLNDPDTTLRVPMFPTDRDVNDFDDSLPPALSDQELQGLKARIVACLPSTQRRRRVPHFLAFRVCVDGQERGHFTPGARVTSLTVPASALRLQVFGQDTEGELPLALFYLPDFVEEATPQRLYAVLEGGATFEVVVTPVPKQDGTITAGRVDLQFWAEEAQVLKTPEWYEAAVTAAGLSVEVARLTGDQRAEAALLARLGALHQAQHQPDDALAYWQASVALAQRMGDKELEATLRAQLAEASEMQDWSMWHESQQAIERVVQVIQHTSQQAVERAVQLVRWLSPPWLPKWVGEPVPAQTDMPPQEHVFRLEDGEITLTCSWKSRYHETPAYVWVQWRADISTPSELWVRFTRPETGTVLAEVRLGSHLAGDDIFTSDDLGFDPALEKWSISLILREVAS